MPVKNLTPPIDDVGLNTGPGNPTLTGTGTNSGIVNASNPEGIGTHMVDGRGEHFDDQNPNGYANYVKQVNDFAAKHPELQYKRINFLRVPEFWKDGKYIGPIENPLWQTPIGDGFTGTKPDGSQWVNGHGVGIAGNDDFLDAGNSPFRRWVVPAGVTWNPETGSINGGAPGQQFGETLADDQIGPSHYTTSAQFLQSRGITDAHGNPIGGVGGPATTTATATGTGTNPLARAAGLPTITRGEPYVAKPKLPVTPGGPLDDSTGESLGHGTLNTATTGNPLTRAAGTGLPDITRDLGGSMLLGDNMTTPRLKSAADTSTDAGYGVPGGGSVASQSGPLYTGPAISGTTSGLAPDGTSGLARAASGGLSTDARTNPVDASISPLRTTARLAGLNRTYAGGEQQNVALLKNGGRVKGYADGGQANWYDPILNGRPIHGSYGQATMPVVNTREEWNALPEWQRRQYSEISNGDNQAFGGYSGPGQAFVDENGRPMFLLNEGNLYGDSRHSGNIRDRSQVHYDPKYGLWTDPRNVVDVPTASFTNGLNATRALIAAAGAYGAGVAGLGAEGLGTAGATAGAEIDPALLADLPGGATASTAGTGLVDAPTIVGAADVGSAGIDPSLLTSIQNGTVDPSLLTNLETTQPGIYQQLADAPAIQSAAQSAGMSVRQWLSNPQNVLSAGRMIAGIAGALSNRGSGDVGRIGAPGTGTTGSTTTAGPGAGTPGVPGSSAPKPMDALNIDIEGDPLSYLQGVGSTWKPNAAVGTLVGEAANAGNAQQQSAAAGRAGADVEQAYRQAEQARRARMIAQGMNPDTEGAALEADRLGDLDRAKALAGGKNIARLTEYNSGFGKRAAAAGLSLSDAAQGLQSDALNAQVAESRGNLSNNFQQARANLRARLAQDAFDRNWQSRESAAGREFQGGQNEAERGLRRDALNANIDIYNQQLRRQRARDIGTGVYSGIDAASRFPWGSLFGGNSNGASSGSNYGTIDPSSLGDGLPYAKGGRVHKPRMRGLPARDPEEAIEAGADSAVDMSLGGPVTGPGSETSDSIPARLSNNETVVNAEGTQFLDKVAPGFLSGVNKRGLMIRRMRIRGMGR